jgi:hypothetical protein
MFWWWGAAIQRRNKRRRLDYLNVNGTARQFLGRESVEAVSEDCQHGNADMEAEFPRLAVTTHDSSFEHHLNSIATSAMRPRLPKWVEKAILLIFPKKSREYLIGDLAEEYAQIAANHGVRFANLWYWKQIIASVWPFLMKALRWGLLVSWVRRLM